MIHTLPLESLEQNADNVYEAIIMIARRARQINELQKQIMDKPPKPSIVRNLLMKKV